MQLGIIQIVEHPSILFAFNPWYAVQFFITDGVKAFLALGSVVLAVTGSEALFADMGHFGKKPMRVAWYGFVMPALLCNYFGQGAMILSLDAAGAAAAIESPFFIMAPEMLRLPLVILATMATFIASQAVISGSFSVTHQAIQLGFIPRLTIKHTSASEAGQIYIPFVNWAIMIAVILLVLTFQSSSNLASAYGIAVTGAMFIDTCLLAICDDRAVEMEAPGSPLHLLAVFFIVDGAYLAGILTKVPDWALVPVGCRRRRFIILTTWAKAADKPKIWRSGMPIEFPKSVHKAPVPYAI